MASYGRSGGLREAASARKRLPGLTTPLIWTARCSPRSGEPPFSRLSTGRSLWTSAYDTISTEVIGLRILKGVV